MAVQTRDVEDESFRKLCAHYSRGCSFVSPCCGKVYPCRLCHNDKELSHQIDRYAISKLVCRKCNTQQPVGKECVDCGVLFGQYFCTVCRLYDDTDKGQFHCDKCGLCRVGGSENFFHCDTCGFCLAASMKDTHACRQEASKNNCPVCMEDIHTSTDPAHVPQCGHLIHMSCYRQLMSSGLYQCPQCQTSLADMNLHWQGMDEERDSWEMPQHLKDFKVQVNCRDCHQQGETPFHVVGLKCSGCGSYNTVRCGSEEIPEDPQPAMGLLNLIRQRLRRHAQEGQDREEESDSESVDEEEQDHSDDYGDGGDDPGNHNTHQPGDHDNQDDEGGDPDNDDHEQEEQESESYDGDASEGNNESDDEPTSDSCDSDDSELRPPRSFMFHTGNYTIFMSPIEVPVGNEPGALEWSSDNSGSGDENEHHRARQHRGSRHTSEQRDDSHRRMVAEQFLRDCQLFGSENESDNDCSEDDSQAERRRAIANDIVSNMRIWGSDSDSYSEMSSEAEVSSSASWVTEEEEVFIGCTREELEMSDNCKLSEVDEWYEPSGSTKKDCQLSVLDKVESVPPKELGRTVVSSEFTKSVHLSSDDGWETANEEMTVAEAQEGV